MMLPRLSRALSNSSKGFFPLTTHLHDGVCFVLRIALVTGPKTAATDSFTALRPVH